MATPPTTTTPTPHPPPPFFFFLIRAQAGARRNAEVAARRTVHAARCLGVPPPERAAPSSCTHRACLRRGGSQASRETARGLPGVWRDETTVQMGSPFIFT